MSADAARALLQRLRDEIEQQLDSLEKSSYGIDVREKYPEARGPVIAVVNSASDAMHALLFVRQRVKELDALLVAGDGLPTLDVKHSRGLATRRQPTRRTLEKRP